MPQEESFLIPLKYIDVSRTTHTNLDVLLEEQIEDCWNVDGERESDAWTGFARFSSTKGKATGRIYMSRWRLTRKQTTSLPDNVWPDMWKHTSDAAKSKANQKWAIEKPKLDSARRLRGIFFIEPNDEEFKLTKKNARRKLEEWKNPPKYGKRKTKYACVVDTDESTRPRLEGAGHVPLQDHITAEGTTSRTQYSLVHKKSFRCLKHSKFLMQRLVGKEW